MNGEDEAEVGTETATATGDIADITTRGSAETRIAESTGGTDPDPEMTTDAGGQLERTTTTPLFQHIRSFANFVQDSISHWYSSESHKARNRDFHWPMKATRARKVRRCTARCSNTMPVCISNVYTPLTGLYLDSVSSHRSRLLEPLTLW